MYIFTTIPIKTQWLFCRNENGYPKIHMKLQVTPNRQNDLEKEQS